MTSKTKLLYKRALNCFISFFKETNHIVGNELNIKFFHCDMEEALIKAIKEIITDTQNKLCYFHFSQSYMRRMHNSIYNNLFKIFVDSKALILSCKALAFIKTEFINDVFYRLKENVAPILNDDFYNYFEKEYVLNYDAENWNYYLKKKHFTNNSCEGYKLLRLFDYKKLSFWQNI